MGQAEKAALYARAKELKAPLEKQYRQYTVAELQQLVDQQKVVQFLPAEPVTQAVSPEEQPAVLEALFGSPAPTPPLSAESRVDLVAAEAVRQEAPKRQAAAEQSLIPPAWLALPVLDPDPIAGLRPSDVPHRRDKEGRIWFVDPIPKSLTVKPRARRRNTYVNPGTTQEVIKYADGSTETVEVAGELNRVSEVTTTLPSYQVGVYIDPKFPLFKIHVYNELEGFDYFDVVNYWGGESSVPDTCKRIYVQTDLCFEMRSVIAAIESAYRELQLTKAGVAPSMVR